MFVPDPTLGLDRWPFLEAKTKPRIIPELHFPPPVAAPEQPLEKGQAVLLVGLQKAPHLNGRRGVVEREESFQLLYCIKT